MATRSNKYTMDRRNDLYNMNSKLRHFVTKDDFEKLLQAYVTAPEDAKVFRKKELEILCKNYGISLAELEKGAAVPDVFPSSIQEELCEYFYHIYTMTPTSKQLMDRIVNRICPELSQHSTRVIILMKFLEGNHKSGLKVWTDMIPMAELSDSVFAHLEVYKTFGRKMRNMISVLDTCINEGCLDAEKKQANMTDFTLSEEVRNRLCEMGRMCGNKRENISNVELLKFIWSAYEKVHTSEMLQLYIPIMIEGLDAVEREFLTQFAGWQCPKQNKNGVASGMQPVVKAYQEKVKEKIRKVNAGLALLQRCQRLADGSFTTDQGATRRDLYEFAFMFGMRFYPNREDEDYDEVLDIEKNLFEDFYNDNIADYLSENGVRKEEDLRTEPIGEGINYKNFAEVSYIYYLYHSELYKTPKEGLKKVENLLSACMKMRAENEKKWGDSSSNSKADSRIRYTLDFEEKFRVILQYPEKKLAELIAQEWDVPLKKEGNYLLLSSDRRTARMVYQELLNDIQDNMSDEIASMEDDVEAKKREIAKLREDIHYVEKDKTLDADEKEKQLTQLEEERNALKAEYLDLINELKSMTSFLPGWHHFRDCLVSLFPEDPQLQRIVKNIDKRWEEVDRKKEKLEDITRIDLMVLHFLYHRTLIREDMELDLEDDSLLPQNFSEAYDLYVSEINSYLSSARFQLFSEKNLFDLFLLFSVYFQIYELQEEELTIYGDDYF